MEKLVLHIGAHKTATTSLQRFFDDRSKTFTDQGAHYHAMSRQTRNAIQLALKARSSARLRVAQRLADELRGIERPTLVSWEGFLGPPFWHGRLYGRSEAAAELFDNLRELIECPIEIVFYVRRQDTFVTSTYIQAVKEGSEASPQEYIEMIKFRSLDWQGCIEPLRQIGLPIFLGAYELAGRSFPQFAAPILDRFPTVRFAEMGDLPVLNLSFSAKALAIAQAANQVGLANLEKRRLRALLERFSGPAPKILRQIDFKRIRAATADANTSLLSAGLTLPLDLKEYYQFSKLS
ncbi:MAG: hypothetical protein KL840_08480 [Aquamicrobium sp.]|nr:hypothetical protein [Aquamicrobium sp.]